MKEGDRPIVLVDLDGTVIDYRGCLERDLEKLRSPNEPITGSWGKDNEPPYIRARMDLIRSNYTWWENLTTFDLGMEVVEYLQKYKFRIVVCTQGPKANADAWKGKMLWCLKNFPRFDENPDIIITRDKGLVYGKVLVDDYPEYALKWLKHRPRGTVIMPVHDYNKDFNHERVIKFSGDYKSRRAIDVLLNKIYTQAK